MTPLQRVVAEAEALGVAAYLVGGPVRDHLRGQALDSLLDLDVVLEGDAHAVARRLGDGVVLHERFGTATWTPAGGQPLDLVTARRERYPRPGVLPEVEAAGIDEDLRRRDFTVNAMAYRLRGGELELIDPFGGQQDLENGVLRALHARSFVDDPTRLLRGARYAARLGLTPEPETQGWIAAAVADGVLDTVSGDRVRHEWERTAAEDRPAAAARLWVQWGIAAALGLPASVDGLERLGRADPELALAAWLAGEGTGRAAAALGLSGAPADRLARRASLRLAPALEAGPADAAEALLGAEDGEVAVLVAARPDLAGAVQAARAAIAALPAISGRDLLGAGVPPGPGIGAGLRAARRAFWAGEASDRQGMLQMALEAAAGP